MTCERRAPTCEVTLLALWVLSMLAACGSPQEVIEPEPVAPPPEPVAGLRLSVLTIQGQTYLQHAELGFLISHPGDRFQWAQDVETRICTSMETELSVECHALWDSTTGMIFTVQVNRVPSAATDDFPEFHAGLLEGLGEAMDIARQGIETDPEGRPLSRILAVARGEGVSVYAQTHPLVDASTGHHYAISVFVYGSDPEGISSLGITYHVP